MGTSGTYAWFSYTDWRKNHMQSLPFDMGYVTIIEDYDGDKQPITPGVNIKKEVNVINTTPVSVFVRVSFEEELQRLREIQYPLEAVPTRMSMFEAASRKQAVQSSSIDERRKGTVGIKDQIRRPAYESDELPIMISPEEYYKETTRWKDETENLTVTGENVPEDKHLKLFVKGADKVLLRETKLNKQMFPENYNFNSDADTFSFVVKDLHPGQNYKEAEKEEFEKLVSGEDVVVAQKVTGVVKDVDEKHTISSAGRLPDSKDSFRYHLWNDIGYHSYGAGVGSSQTMNWAGQAQWVPEFPKLSVGSNDNENKNSRLFSVPITQTNPSEVRRPQLLYSGIEVDELDHYKIKPEDRDKEENKKFEKDNWYNYSPGYANLFDWPEELSKSIIQFNFGNELLVINSGIDNFGEAPPYWLFNEKDNYFYYSQPLEPGQTTKVPVITGLTFPSELRYYIAGYDLHVSSEAIPTAQLDLLTAESLQGKVTNQEEISKYEETGKITVKDGSGFGLDSAEDKALIEYYQGLIKE